MVSIVKIGFAHTSVFMGLTEFNSIKEAWTAVTSCSIEIVIKSNGGCSSWVGGVQCNYYQALEGGCIADPIWVQSATAQHNLISSISALTWYSMC